MTNDRQTFCSYSRVLPSSRILVCKHLFPTLSLLKKISYIGITMQNEQNEYRTKDLYISAFLFMKNEKLSSIDQITPKRFEFVFEMSDNLLKLVEDFYSKRALVEPMEYAMAMKRVKIKMYSNEK